MNEHMKNAWDQAKEMIDKAEEIEKISMDAEIRDRNEIGGFARHEKTGRITIKIVIHK